jgi:hypothetical protein
MVSIPESHNCLRIAFDGAIHIRVSPEIGRRPRSEPNVLLILSSSFRTRP